jgi:hypothetical protein
VLADADPDSLCVGIEMELIVTTFFQDEIGRDVLGYKFRRVLK